MQPIFTYISNIILAGNFKDTTMGLKELTTVIVAENFVFVVDDDSV